MNCYGGSNYWGSKVTTSSSILGGENCYNYFTKPRLPNTGENLSGVVLGRFRRSPSLEGHKTTRKEEVQVIQPIFVPRKDLYSI